MTAPTSPAVTLQPVQPFAWDTILQSLRTSPGTVLERIGDTSYIRALHIDGRPTLVSVEGDLRPTRTLTITAKLGGEATGLGLSEAAAKVASHVFQTHVDTTALDDIEDPAFAAVWAPCRGFRPVQLPTVWEAIAWAIIGQQINVAFAARCKAAFCDAYGARLETPSGTFTLFPTPETVAPLEEASLHALQFSRQKARYVIGVARAIVEGRFDPEALHALPAEVAIESLMALKGVGRWTAEYVLLRGLGYPDALPAGDVALQRAVGLAYGLGRLATEAEVRTYGERWAPFRSYATIAFWRSNARASGPSGGATAP